MFTALRAPNLRRRNLSFEGEGSFWCDATTSNQLDRNETHHYNFIVSEIHNNLK